ncbi:iron-sulfur cluster biosynthesis family protein [uncultured Limosilactobacillus sp.]|uniref:iron-sulfur cluster biosynthesis family protein n=1 Tax=uncultured Limosilactobacillus sp. TaxID=2837629 RepID=UPI0025F515DF|nr:iron-sulfur cluster biosynthesis family protein [uncultured Limosilactobacillus sp.]
MKKLTVTTEALERIKGHLSPTKKIVLDFDDGVGPFSAIGNCNLDANYRLIFVNHDVDLPDFDEVVSSNIGDIYIKSELYANVQFEPEMELRFDRRHFALPLVSPKGVLTENVELVDIDQPVDHQYAGTHDC